MIVWLGISPPLQPPPSPSEGRGVQVRKYFAENYQIKSPALIPRVRIGTPLPSEGSGEAVGLGGGFCISLCKTDSYKGICGTCYSSTPKNDCFLNKVAYLCKQRTESPPTASPDLPEPTVTDRREVKGRRSLTPTPLRMVRGVNSKISPKMFRS